jgi:hypothetical protein
MTKDLSTEATLDNAGLSAEDQQLFSNARPRAYEPYPI